MRAVVYPDYGVVPELAEAAEPGCPEDGVVISVGATGVCRSDWHAWKGHDPVALPHIPGHELAGTIAQAGPAVTRWRPGDRVTVPFACPTTTLPGGTFTMGGDLTVTRAWNIPSRGRGGGHPPDAPGPRRRQHVLDPSLQHAARSRQRPPILGVAGPGSPGPPATVRARTAPAGPLTDGPA